MPIYAGVRILDSDTTVEIPPALPVELPAPAGGATYAESLALGDKARSSRQFDRALADFQAARNQAANNTERALAIAKQGEIFAFDLRNYSAAKSIIQEPVHMNDIKPVAQVIALHVLAECQMKADKDYKAAASVLEQAAQLRGVEWAQPAVAIKLGDCYRFTGRYNEAVAVYQKLLGMPAANRAIKAVTYLNIGLTYQYDLGDTEKAKAAYTQAAELKPDLKSEIDGHLARIQ